MPTTIAELADDTAFERLVLDRMFPLMLSSDGATAVIDLGTAGSVGVAASPQPVTAKVSVSVRESIGSPAGQMSLDSVRPLVFGAAPTQCETFSPKDAMNTYVTRWPVAGQNARTTNERTIWWLVFSLAGVMPSQGTGSPRG